MPILAALAFGAWAPLSQAQSSKGLLDGIIDPLLGEEGEGDDSVIDDLIDPILGGEGEGDGGLLDDLIDLLPLPIEGLDPFEPDNNPEQARWSGLVNSDLINTVEDLTDLVRTHNFHVDGDEDWVRFYARAGQTVRIETRDLLSRADTFLSIYRVLRAGEPTPATPNECIDEFIEGPLGTTLIPVGCNDNAAGGIDSRRSLVQFTVEVTGYYYSRVRFSPNAAASGNKGADGSGPETTYNYAGSYSGLVSSTLYCTVLADEDDDPITDALVHLDPGSIDQTYNQSGVYPFDGIPSGVYTVTVSAPGRETEQAVVNVGEGEQKVITVYLQSSQPPVEGEGGGGEEGEGEGGGGFSLHSADYMSPYGLITLEELLRVIQFYNARSYHCSEITEDGYAPYPGERTCEQHQGDYEPADWTHSLNELLRTIQLFNVGPFVVCEEGEDGVCPEGS